MIGNTQQFDADVGQAIFASVAGDEGAEAEREAAKEAAGERPPQWTWKHLTTVPGAGK